MKAIYKENSEFQGTNEKDISLLDIVSIDIEMFVSNYVNQTTGISALSATTGIGVRSIWRYILKEGEPSVSSLVKLYLALNNKVRSKKEFELSIHPLILKRIEGHPSYRTIQIQNNLVGDWFENEMLHNKAFRKVYMKAQVANKDNPCTTEWATFKYGELGFAAVKKMVSTGLLLERNGQLEINKQNVPAWSGKLISEVAKETIENNLKSENMAYDGQNAVGLQRKSLNKNAYLELQRKMQRFYIEINDFMELEENQGDMQAFFAMAMDTEGK